MGALPATCVVDVLFAGADGTSVLPLADPVWPTLAVLLVGLAAVLWPAGRRPEWLTRWRAPPCPPPCRSSSPSRRC
ncbi:hypothetical protein DF19_21035 [Streptomyces olindensis]|nr:hypothetical protein DF19_21035 [Streptomyces olindensis]